MLGPAPKCQGLCGWVGKRTGSVKEEDGAFLALVVS